MSHSEADRNATGSFFSQGLLEPDQRLVAVLLRTLGSSGLDPEAAARSQPA